MSKLGTSLGEVKGHDDYLTSADGRHVRYKFKMLIDTKRNDSKIHSEGMIAETEKLIIGWFEYAPQGGETRHSVHNDREQAVFVLEGEGVWTVGGQELPVKPGSCVFIPLNTEHSYRNTGETPLRFLIFDAMI